MHSLTTPEIKNAGWQAGGYGELQGIRYRTRQSLSRPSLENLHLCVLPGCVEPRSGRNGLCEQHSREYYRARYRASRAAYQAWFSAERQRKIEQLLQASTPSERESIERGRKAGRILRQKAEAMQS